MRSEDLQEVIRATPFRPFAIVFADGKQIVVPHPEWILFQGGRTAVVMDTRPTPSHHRRRARAEARA